MILKIVASLHFATTVVCLYFLLPKSAFDFVYLIYVYATFLSWTIFGGQCPVSYALKKQCPKCDQSSMGTDDLYELFGEKHRGLMQNILKITAVTQLIGVYVVLTRNGLSPLRLAPLPLYYFLSYSELNIVNIFFFFVFLFMVAQFLRLLTKKI